MKLEKNLFIPKNNQHPRIHSKELDQKFGFNIDLIEKNIEDKFDSNSWVGLEPEILQTPYSEILEFLSHLGSFKPSSIIDLGSGYGRVALVMKALFKQCEFIGYEIHHQRAQEGNRVFKSLELENCHIQATDILKEDFLLPDSDVYFIYDFTDPHDQKRILNQLSDKVFTNEFFIIAKGQGVRSLIQAKYPQFYSLYRPLHMDSYSIYCTFKDLV